MATNSKTQLPKSIEWLGKTIIGYSTKELQVRVWKMVLDYERDNQVILRVGNKNNVILTHPSVKEWQRQISFGSFLSIFGISRYSEKGNGGYHPREVKRVLESVGYELQVSEATASKQALTKQCPKCKEALPNKAVYCWKCSTKQPEIEAVKGKGKAEVKPEVKPVKKPRKSNRPTGKAILEVSPKPEEPVTLPELPTPYAEVDGNIQEPEVKPEVSQG